MGSDGSDRVVFESATRAADYRALYWWLLRQPGPARRQHALLLLFIVVLAAAVLLSDLSGAGVFVGVLAVLVLALPWRYGAVNERVRGLPSRRITIDAEGVHWSGPTNWEVGWHQVDAAATTSTHLFLHHGAIGYVVPIAGLDDASRSRIEAFRRSARASAGGPFVGADPVGAATDALVVRWQSSARDNDALLRFARSANPAARRLGRVRRAVGIGLAIAALLIDGGITDRVLVTFALIAMWLFGLPRLSAWISARALPAGACEVRLDRTGLSHQNPTAQWQAGWDAVRCWGRTARHVVVLAAGDSAVAIPFAAMPDRAEVEALLAAHVGPASRTGLVLAPPPDTSPHT